MKHVLAVTLAALLGTSALADAPGPDTHYPCSPCERTVKTIIQNSYGPSPPPPQQPQVACAVVSQGPPLNLRTYPNGPIIASYWPGTPVVIDSVDPNNPHWGHATITSWFGPVSGWMFGPMLVPIQCWF